jgi:hypothetical protein
VNVARIRGFLLKVPKPVIVRITVDGETQDLKPNKGYAKCAETIAAMGPELIQCLDAEQTLLRAMRTDNADAQRSDAAEVPAILQTDPHAALLTHFSNLLHRAYEHSTEVAFSRLVELTDRMNERSDQIERRLERAEAANRRAIEDQVSDAFERAEEIATKATEQGAGGGGLGDQMMQAFLSGRMRSAAAKPNGSNGGGAKGSDA